MQPLEEGDPVSVGPYRLTARLGEGGMGVVYLARTATGRSVAVKTIRAELGTRAEFRRRFRAEVAAARRVGGFHTAPVVDADPDGSPPWLATVYVDGRPLHRAAPLPPDELRTLAVGLAEALASIHAAGVVHRDLKPSNVLMTDDGPRVIDFGIARAVESTLLTVAGAVLGSPGYMSPEQALGCPVGPPGDVFSLGAVLAFAAGARGFGDGPVPALLYRVVHDEPDLDGVPADLLPVVRACLAKDPAGRPTPEDLLARLTRDGPPTAPATVLDLPRPAPPRPFRRRLPLGLALAVALTAVLAVPFLLDPAHPTTSGTAPPPTPASAPRLSPPALPANTLLTPVIDVPDPPATAELVFSADGSKLAARGDDLVRVTDLRTGSTTTLPHADHYLSLAFSPDGAVLATGRGPAEPRDRSAPDSYSTLLWDTATGTVLRTFTQTDPAAAVAFSPDGSWLAIGTLDGVIRLWDRTTWRLSYPLSGHAGAVTVLLFAPDGKTLASVDQFNALRLWNVADHTSDRHDTLLAVPAPERPTAGSVDEALIDVKRLAFTPDGRTLVAAQENGDLRRVLVASGAETRQPRLGFTRALSADARVMVVNGHDDDLTIRLPDTGRTLLDLPGYQPGSVTLSPDGHRLAAFARRADDNARGPLQVWDVHA
ncbi:WD40 repeat domain-containing serine/threonine protein kinase [Kitasatospora sp. NPDC101183]|uniref:WD40 repeat domain-containing serine/threonine protein kinase n=1 Tax=Kitasatospora sp. NPDC101183 TaxID=3364100 RepID=UPI00380BBDDA